MLIKKTVKFINYKMVSHFLCFFIIVEFAAKLALFRLIYNHITIPCFLHIGVMFLEKSPFSGLSEML